MPVKEGRINQKEKNKMKQNFYGWIHHARVRQIRKLEALCENAGISPGRLWVLCEKTEYSLPEDMIPYRHWPEADELIDRDLTLREIAEKVDHKRETIRLYIRNSLQYDYKNKIKVERE